MVIQIAFALYMVLCGAWTDLILFGKYIITCTSRDFQSFSRYQIWYEVFRDVLVEVIADVFQLRMKLPTGC
jgi:hypothetical protein